MLRSRLPPLLQQRDYALYWTLCLGWNLSLQMVSVAVGWQVYAIHRNPFDIGLVGLLQFLPLPILAIPSGQLGDRISRRLVLAIAYFFAGTTAVGLTFVSLFAGNQLWPFLALGVSTGVALALGTPSLRAIAPELVAAGELPVAMTLRSLANQMGTVIGPAVGGVLFTLAPQSVYGVATAIDALAVVLAISLYRRGGWTPAKDTVSVQHLLGGIRFLAQSQLVLGAILLDLVAVLFGGATALLPVLARTTLHVGPAGLGLMQSAPAIGSVIAGMYLTRRPLAGSTGATLLAAVGIYGASMIIVGLSTSFILALAALGIGGVANMFSASIRATTVALATPNNLRGRVNAIEMVFLSASNELGAFESGVTAALVGTVRSIVAGGVLTVVFASSWRRLFPALGKLDHLEDIRPATDESGMILDAQPQASGL
jgi:MFS family permease